MILSTFKLTTSIQLANCANMPPPNGCSFTCDTILLYPIRENCSVASSQVSTIAPSSKQSTNCKIKMIQRSFLFSHYFVPYQVSPWSQKTWLFLVRRAKSACSHYFCGMLTNQSRWRVCLTPTTLTAAGCQTTKPGASVLLPGSKQSRQKEK